MSWMATLSNHYFDMRKNYPQDNLMIVFDIDDTIVDIRIPLLYNLKKFDVEHGTLYFQEYSLEDITFEEWQIERGLQGKIKDPSVIEDIKDYIRKRMWQEDTILLSHRPFRGVLEIIRWFQIQENTTVGLNTGRSNQLRDITLRSLNTLGKEFRVQFKDELLYMNPLENTEDKDVTSYKARGIQYFNQHGYRVIAFIDNEPANLQVVDHDLDDPELLLLHADTIFKSSKKLRPTHSIAGNTYNISDVIDPVKMPQHIEFVWNGVNTTEIYLLYEKSNVYWGEIDVRMHPLTGEIVLRHERFDTYDFDSSHITLEDMFDRLNSLQRGIKLVLKEDDGLLDELVEFFNDRRVESSRLWFDIIFEVFDVDGLEKIKSNFPASTITTRVDFLVPLLSQMPDTVKDILSNLYGWGIDQFSVSMNTYNKELFIEKMDDWGFDLNIRDIYTLEEFLQAVILLPTSIISTFEFMN